MKLTKQHYIIMGIVFITILIVVLLLLKKKKEQMITEATNYFSKDFNAKEAAELAILFEKYFSWSEFDSPDVPGSGKANIKPKSLAKYVRAREAAQIPFKVNSAFRTEKHNKEVGGVKDSAHTKGYAFDTSTKNKDEKIIIKALLDAGFNRIGVYNTFIHADDDPTLPQNVAWNRFNSINQVKTYIA